MQGHLQVVILQNLEQSVFQARDFQVIWDALDESQGLDICTNILQQAANEVCVVGFIYEYRVLMWCMQIFGLLGLSIE